MARGGAGGGRAEEEEEESVFKRKEKPTQNQQNSSRLFPRVQMYINAGAEWGDAALRPAREKRLAVPFNKPLSGLILSL